MTLDEVKRRAATLDRGNLESYLSDAEFQKAFGVSRTQFTAMPKSQQFRLKSSSGLLG
jgi:hypothetical protein